MVRLPPVEQNAASRTGGVQMPLSYIEGDRLVIYDTQGRRYELALDNSPAEAPVQYTVGQLISVGNILSKDIQEKQLEISKERSDAFKKRIETLNKEIDQFAKDIKELEQRQTRALQMNDTVMLQGVFVQMLSTREELARKHLEAITLRKQYLEEQRQIALVKYKMAITEQQPAQKAALFRSIQNAIETELAALNQREVSINQSLNNLNNQLTEARAKLESYEGRKAGSKAEQVVPVITAVDQYIQDYLSNNKLEDLISQITAENLTITIPTKDQGDITVSARLIRDRLLEGKNYNNLIDFVNGFQGTQQDLQKILDSVLMVTFDRAGASSISEGYEGAVMSAVAARAKDAGVQEKNLKETAQKYINQQQFSISAVGKERESLQLKQAAKKNLQFAIDQLHELIGNLLSEEDQALVNLSNLEDSEKMINELLDLMGLEEGSSDYADMLSNLQNLGDDLVRLYSMAKALSLADSEFSSLLARAIKTPDLMANEIIKLEGITQEEQASRRNELAGNTAMENLQHFLILTHMAKTLVTPQSDNFQQVYDLLKTGDTGMDYLRKSLLTELIISLDVDAKLKSKIDKEAKATGKPVTEVRANQLRADIEKNDLGILTKRDQLLLTPNIADLQLTLRESLVKSGKYTADIRKQLHARTGDLQQRVAQYDLIHETVPDDIIADAFTSVMLASLIDNGYYFRDVQYFSGALMANGAILNVGTGEGKTITSALTLYLHSLSGETAVQFLTQESFARSDASSVKGIMDLLNVKVDVVTKDTNRAKVKELFMRKQDRDKLREEDPTVSSQPQIVYIPFSDFAFMRLEDVYYDADKKTLPEKMAYANFDEIDALIFEGSLMDFINAQPSDPLTEEQVQTYRLIWDFVLKIRGDGASLEQVKDTDKDFHVISDLVQSFQKQDESFLFKERQTSDGNFIELTDGARDLIRQLHAKAQEQNYKIPDIREFEDMVKITLEQHFFHKQRVNWTFEAKKDENGQVITDANNDVVQDIKLINAQGEHTNQRQSNHRHTIMEVWAKYYLGVNIDVLGDSETTGKVGGADVIKAFEKFTGFSGSIATEVARAEMKKLFGKDSIIEMAPFIQKVINRRETGVFNTKSERDAYLLDQVEQIFNKRDGAPILAGTRDYAEAEQLYTMMYDRLETMAEEEISVLVDVLPADKQASIREKINQFRDAKAIRAEGDATTMNTKRELALEIESELRLFMLDSYINELNNKQGRLDEIADTLAERIRINKDDQQAIDELAELNKLKDEFANIVESLQKHQANIQQLYTDLANAWKARDADAANTIISKLQNEFAGIEDQKIRVIDGVPSSNQDEFLYLGFDQQTQSQIESLLNTVDRLSKVYTFHGNSFKTEAEEEEFLEIACARGSVTFVNPYGTRGKDFKLTLFKMSQFNTFMQDSVVKKALQEYYQANPQELDALIDLLELSDDQKTSLKNMVNKKFELGIFSILESLVKKLEDNRDALTRNKESQNIQTFFSRITDAINQSVSNPLKKTSLVDQLDNIEKNLRAQLIHGFQVFEVGISLSERITLQLFGRGGRAAAPRSEQTLIALEADETEIAVKAFNGVGTREGKQKLFEYINARELLEKSREEIKQTLTDMGITDEQALRDTMDTILTFQRGRKLERGILADLSSQILAYLVDQNDSDAKDKTRSFVEQLRTLSQEELLSQDFVDQAAAVGLTKAHIDQIITVRFQETMTEAQATLEQAIMLARAKADVRQYMLSEQEQQLDANKLNELVTIRARQLLYDFDAVIAANPDLADKLNRTNYTLSDQDMAAIDNLRNSLDSYTNTELDIANLFREAQEYLDIIDSEKRVTKSYFDDVEYRFSQQAGVLKSELEKDTYMTEDDVQFTLALNLKMLDSVFANYQESNNFNQLQRDLAILGIEIDESAKDSIDSLKADLTSKIESGLITFLYDNAMDEAFRGANAKLLKEWSQIKSQYQNELRQEIDKIKKNGLAKKEVRELVNMPFTIYTQTISDIEKSDLAGDELAQAKQNAFVQLQKDLGALNISITEADLEQLSNFQNDVVKQVDQGKITLDFVVFGGVLGPEFLIASKQLYDRTSEIRDQFQKNLDDQIKKVIDKFEAEIEKSFKAFEDGILDSYAQSVMANRKQYVEQIEKSELLDVGTKEKNTARTVDDAVDQLYKQRKIDLMKSEPSQESRLVRVADRAVNFIMKNIFRRQKADDQLITRQKASNRVFEKLERVEETAEITPSAIFPVQAVNLSQDNRSIADKKELVKPQVKVTAQDGQLQYENIGDQDIQQADQVIEGVKGAIKVTQREDGTKALEIEIDSMDQAAQAIIDRLEGYAAVKGGGLDLDAIIIKSNGETTATLELGKRAIFELQNRKYAPQLENLLKNGGLIKVGDNVIVFGKNKAGKVEGHDLGHIQDVSPEIFTVFQIKQLLDGIGGMQGLMMMSKDEQQAFFRDNPVVRSPLFSKIQMGQVYLENGVVLVGDNMYNKDNVAKGAILINAKLGDKVNVGRNSVIIDSEIGKYSPVSSDIGDNVQIRNAKIGRYSNIEDGARVSQVIVNGLTLGQDADVERINAATQSVAVGARSIVIDYESDQSLAVADDHYKQGVDQAMGYNSEQMGEMIIRDGGKVVETIKNIQNKLFKWSNQINKNYPENKFMQGISKALNFAGRLVSSITPEGRRWAAARKEQAARDKSMQEQYKDQRERLQQDLQTPYDFLFQLDPQESFASQVSPELEKISQVADEDARRAALEGYVIRNFSQYSQPVQQHLIDILSGVIDESLTSDRDLIAILIDKLFTDVNDMMDRLDSMTSLEDIQIAEGLLDVLRRAYPDTKVTNTDARDIALKGAEIAAQQGNTELQRSYLVKALNFNAVLLELDAQDADALRQETEIFGKLNIDLEQMANAIEEQFKNVRSAIIAQLDAEPSLTAAQKTKLADYFLSLISLQTNAIPVAINPQILNRQVGGFGAAKTDLYSYVADTSVDQNGYLNFGQERSDIEADARALGLDLDAVRALINISELDPSARWSGLSDSWNTLLRDGKETYQDEFFDSIRPILQRFPVSVRNKVAGAILKSYSNAGSGIALRDDLLREAAAIQKDIDSGIWTGDILRDKTHEALALMHIVAMMSPFDVEILSQVAKLHADMASYNNRQDINSIDQAKLEAALIDAGIAVSRVQAVEMAQAIITQRNTTPVKFLDDISNDILTSQQKEMLRNANIAGSEEIARFHRSTAQEINNRVLILAREQKLDTTAALVMQQIDVLMHDQYVRPDQMDPLLEEFKKTVDNISNAKERTALQQKYDYYSLKTTYQKNQQNLSSQAEVDARKEAQQAVQDALNNIGTKSPYYVDAQFIKAQMLEQVGDITQADKLYQSIMKKYPERAAEASSKQLALSTKQGDSIEFLTQTRPETLSDQQQAIEVLGKLRDSIQNGSLSQKPSYLNDVMQELLNWHTAVQQNGLSDQMMSEILQTISSLNQYVASLVSQNISNPDRAHDVTLWTAMQDTIISALTRLQSGMAGTELAAIAPIILNPELVNADAEYVGFVPVVAMLGDNIDLFAVDESGILNDQLQQYKMQQLADFIALFAPDAQVSMVGDKIMVAGLSAQQLSVFNDMFTDAKTLALNQMTPVLIDSLQEWFSSIEADQLVAHIAEKWNLSDDQATAIAELKGQDAAVISEALENLITEKFLQKSLQKYMLDQLNDQVNLLTGEKEKKLADRAAKVAAQAPQNEIDAIDQAIASIDAQITQFQQLANLVSDKKVFDTTNFQLITATSAAPAELPALANYLKNNDLDSYKEKINEMIGTIQAEIDAMEATLASLSNDQLRQLGRLKETVRELNSLKSITSYDAFNKAVAENTNLMRDIVKTLINNFAQAEQNELERLQTAKGVTLANAARSASDLSGWMNLWESITDKAFRDTFAEQFQEVASARNRFLYLQKLNQGASETELAPLRKELEQDFIKALGQFGQYLAPQVISMIERTNGDIQRAVSFVQQSFGEDIAGQIVSFFAGPDAQQPTIGAVYANYVQKVSDIMALTVERKAQELMLDEEGIFTSEQISTLRDMGISDPFSLNANEVAIMRNILDKMDGQKQVLNSWLKQQDGITSQNRSDVRNIIFDMQGLNLGSLSPLETKVLQKMIPQYDLSVRMDANENIYLMPGLDKLNTKMIESQLAKAGVVDAAALLNQIINSEGLQRANIVFEMPSADSLFAGSPVSEVESTNDYIERFLGTMLDSVGFKAFASQEPKAAEFIIEYVDSLREHRPLELVDLDLAGFQFMVKAILQQRIVQFLIENPSERSNRVMMDTASMMFDRAIDVYNIVLQDKTNLENREFVEKNLQELSTIFSNLKAIRKAMFDEYATTGTVSDAMLASVKEVLVELETKLAEVVPASDMVLLADQRPDPTDVEAIVNAMSEQEIEIMQLCLSKLLGVTEHLTPDADEETHNRERLIIGRKFFKAVEYNKNRVDMFIDMLKTIVNKNYLQEGNQKTAEYKNKIDTLEGRIVSFTDALAARDQQSPVKQTQTNIAVQPLRTQLLEDIMSGLDPELQNKLRAVFDQVRGHVGVDIVQGTIKADPIIEHFINQLDEVSAENVRELIFKDRMKAYFGLLVEQALNSYLPDETMFRETYLFLRNNGITSQEQSQNALMEFFINVYTGAALSTDMAELFATMPQAVQRELLSFMENKIPALSEVRMRDTNTDKRVELVRVLKNRIGENVFELPVLDARIKQVVRNFLVNEMSDVVNAKQMDNQYVFAINFDAISENGKISVNESNFILKETIKAQEQRAKAEGKELRFAVVSDKFSSEHIIKELAALRLSELDVDVFAKDLGTGDKSFNDLLAIVQDNYNVDTDNIKMVIGAGNADILRIATSKGIQVMEVNPKVNLEKTASGEILAQTLVGSLNLFVKGTLHGFDSIPENTTILGVTAINDAHQQDMAKLLANYTISFDADSAFIRALRALYGADLSIDQLRAAFLRSLSAYVLSNNPQLAKQPNINAFKQQLGVVLSQTLANEALYNQLFAGVFAQSMQSLVLQSPKQKISNAYLREFEKMKVAEEFA